MNKELFLLLVITCILTHMVRLVYEILKHKKALKAGKVSFIIIFINMIILWISWILLCRFDISKIAVPGIIRYTGISLAGVGLIIFLAGLLTIKTLESYEGDLITTGIYSIIRHPMYLGFILWVIGFPIFFGAFYSLILATLFIINILIWRYLEEIELEKRFPFYADYRKKTIF